VLFLVMGGLIFLPALSLPGALYAESLAPIVLSLPRAPALSPHKKTTPPSLVASFATERV